VGRKPLPYTGAVTWDVIVVGGGPAGLMSALAAAGSGARAVVLERMPSPARKLLASGGGQGNLTHAGEIADFLPHYHGGERPGAAGRFLRPALYAFSNRDLAAFCARRGLPLVEDPDGRAFPRTRRAGDVLELLLAEARRLRVEVRTGVRVLGLRAERRGFTASSPGVSFSGRVAVLATGGRSYPSLGATGDGYLLAAAVGHRVVPPLPALAPVQVRRAAFGPFASCAGVALRGTEVALVRGGEVLARRRGDVLFTHRGLSGPAVLDLSRDAAPGDLLRVALAPGLGDLASAEGLLEEEVARRGLRTVPNLLSGLGVPGCVARAAAAAVGVPLSTKAAELTRAARRDLAGSLVGHPFPVAAVGGWDVAMVTRGGVALDEVDPKTMESRLVPGLFFAGEVLDVDGDTGGYNLQAAFSTGRLAGLSAARRALGRGTRPGRKVPPHQRPRPAREPNANPRNRPHGKPGRSPRTGWRQDHDLPPRDEKRRVKRPKHPHG